MGAICTSSEQSEEEKACSEKIDKEIRQQRKMYDRQINLLLLGKFTSQILLLIFSRSWRFGEEYYLKTNENYSPEWIFS